MKFQKAPDDKYLKARYVSEDGNVELGISMVMFGWRIHAGKTGYGCYEIDYCCGAEQSTIEMMLSMIKNILEKTNCDWRQMPIQNTKPIFNDPQCLVELIELSGPDFEKLVVPDVKQLRKEISKYIYSDDEA